MLAGHELLGVGGVVLPLFLVGERHARHDFLALNGLEQEAALELLAKLLQREAFLLQRLQQPGVVELVLFLDVLDRLFELLVGELRADFTASLHEEQLVERVHENGRRHVVERLAQRRIVLQVLRTDLTLILIP